MKVYIYFISQRKGKHSGRFCLNLSQPRTDEPPKLLYQTPINREQLCGLVRTKQKQSLKGILQLNQNLCMVIDSEAFLRRVFVQADFDTPSNVTARSVPQTCIHVCKDTKEQQHRCTRTNPLIHSSHRAAAQLSVATVKTPKNKTKSSFTQSSQLKFCSCNTVAGATENSSAKQVFK